MTFPMPKDIVANAKVRRRLLWDATHVPGAAKRIREQCASDILFWINAFCFTFDPRKIQSVIPFVTYDYQDEAILEIQRAISDGYDIAIEKSRDMGASWLNVVVPTHQLQFGEAKNFLLVSRNESYVDEKGNPKSLFWKIDFLIRHQPKWLLPARIIRKDMHIENDTMMSVISGESTTGEVGRGDRRTAILMDEFAAFETKSGYAALASTQSTTNCRIFNSTPKGVSNAFYDVVHKTGARIIRMHWSQHPDKSRGLYTSKRNEQTGKMDVELLSDFKGFVEVCEKGSKSRRRVMFPEDYPFVLDGKTRSPWYDRECSRAVNPVEIAQELDIDYQGSDYQFFDPIAIDRYRDKWCVEPVLVGDLEFDGDRCMALRVARCVHGSFSMFEDPVEVSRDRMFAVGIDVSAGTGASNSTAAVYDIKTREKVAEYANPNILPDEFGRFAVALARFFNDAIVVPDRSGPTGEVFVRRMIAEGYGNIYLRRNERKLGSPRTNEPGIWLNPSAKTKILQQYRDAIGRCAIINRSAVAMAECLRFVMTQSGNVEHSAESGSNDPSGARTNHGDLVIADALANIVLMEYEAGEVEKNQEFSEGTLGWRMHVERTNEMERNQDELGEEWE